MFELKEVEPNGFIIDKNMIKLGNRNQIYLDDGNVWILEMYEGKDEYKANGEDLFSVFDGFSVLEDAVSIGLRLNDHTYQGLRDLKLGHGLNLLRMTLAGTREAESRRKRGVAKLKAHVKLRLEIEIAPLAAETYLALIPDKIYDFMWIGFSNARSLDIDAFTADYMEGIVKNIIYGLYKREWMTNRHLTAADEERVKNVYLQQCAEDGEAPTDEGADAFLMECGFNGELYVCFPEFLDNEFLNAGYMKYLLPGPLFALWKKMNGDKC